MMRLDAGSSCLHLQCEGDSAAALGQAAPNGGRNRGSPGIKRNEPPSTLWLLAPAWLRAKGMPWARAPLTPWGWLWAVRSYDRTVRPETSIQARGRRPEAGVLGWMTGAALAKNKPAVGQRSREHMGPTDLSFLTAAWLRAKGIPRSARCTMFSPAGSRPSGAAAAPSRCGRVFRLEAADRRREPRVG